MDKTWDGKRTQEAPLGVARAVLYGTLTVFLLDGLDACLFWYLRAGSTPAQIFRSVAAGFVGRDAALAGGAALSLLGLSVHLLVAFCVASTFALASRRLPGLVRRPIFWGVVYGLAVYTVMYYGVMPLSAIGMPKWPPVPIPFVNNILIHIFGVGLPSAYWAWRAAGGARPVRRRPELSAPPGACPPDG